VNNSIKHASANKIYVQLIQNEQYISLTVSDDGVGFDPTSVKEGMGMDNLRARLDAFGGKIDILSEPNGGCEANIVINLD